MISVWQLENKETRKWMNNYSFSSNLEALMNITSDCNEYWMESNILKA